MGRDVEHGRQGEKGSVALGTAVEALYARALEANRSGALYNAFPYPTKISPVAVALWIAAHTSPGDTVFDGFAGSGTTGLGALLCENPPGELRAEARRIGLNVQWGARNAVLYELGALGAFVGQTLTNPPEPRSFRRAAEEILREAEADYGWVYYAMDTDGRRGTIRHVIWSDLLLCPACLREVSLWDACVSFDPVQIASEFICPVCLFEAPRDIVERLTVSVKDDLVDEQRILRARRPVYVYGSTGKKRWSRAATPRDLSVLACVENEPVPESVPEIEIPWGDLYRRGYHQGLTHLHHFYTPRNLYVFARLWSRCASYGGALADALRFWLLSYNSSHATLMTRVVAKSGQKDLVVTSAQTGVLYVSGLPVEKNLLAGLRRKLSTIGTAFTIIHGRKGRVAAHQKSSCSVDLLGHSVDYAFTDPPFGGNIPYAEVSFLNEAWLGRYTERDEEAIVSNAQKKAIPEYQDLLRMAFSEVHRILKPDGKMTLVFHSASAEVWNALQTAYTDAGFGVEYASVLNKTQRSFKQITTDGAVRGDPVLLLNKQSASVGNPIHSVWSVAEKLQAEADRSVDPGEQTAQRLYSRLVSHYLTRHQQVPLDAEQFYHWHKERRAAEVNRAGTS